MAEWIYRARSAQADWAATDESLSTHNFLCRPVYEAKNRQSGTNKPIPNVRHVVAGDVIHVALKSNEGFKNLGTFEILGERHSDAEGQVIDETHGQLSLFSVRPDSALERMLRGTTYSRDPKLGVYTGWHVRKAEPRDIQFTSAMFPGNNALHRYNPGAEASLRTPAPLPRTASPSLHCGHGLAAGVGFRSLGVDWSGAAQAGTKVWAASIDVAADGAGQLVSVARPFSGALGAAGVSAGFDSWLQGQQFEVAGLDFCFGLSQDHALSGLPRSDPNALGQWVAKQYPDPLSFKAALGAEKRRMTDRARRAPFAPTNLRMFRQTYWGLRAVADLKVPILPWGVPGARVVVEVLPAHVAAAVCLGHPYKGRSNAARENRRRLLLEIARVYRLAISAEAEATILADTEGDAMDAVLAAVAAAVARASGFAGVPTDAASSGEGWIYSVS